jgi:serine/threonine protein kinase
MYALGVLLYFMLFGKPPYIYPNLFNPDDVELANVIK